MTTYFAKVKDGTVENVIVADQSFVDSLPSETGVEYVQTDKKSYHGTHDDGGTPFRHTFAEIGGTYDKTNDIFLDPKPGKDWTLDENKFWVPPEPYPDIPEDMAYYEWKDGIGWVEIKTYY